MLYQFQFEVTEEMAARLGDADVIEKVTRHEIANLFADKLIEGLGIKKMPTYLGQNPRYEAKIYAFSEAEFKKIIDLVKRLKSFGGSEIGIGQQIFNKLNNIK